MSKMNTMDSATRMATHALSGNDRTRSKRDLRLAGGSFILIHTSLQRYDATIRKAIVAGILTGRCAVRTVLSFRQTPRPSSVSLHSNPCTTCGQSVLRAPFAFRWPPMLKFLQSGGVPRPHYLKKPRR